jgi:hypothetical protein
MTNRMEPDMAKTIKKARKKSSTRYAKPRVVQSWSTRPRAYLSGLGTAAWDDGKRGKHIVEAVTAIVPRWRSWFDTPPTDRALSMRAHNSRCGPTSKTEAPEVSAHKKPVWPIAKRDYKAGVCSLPHKRKRAA